jgi:hypothetical protein
LKRVNGVHERCELIDKIIRRRKEVEESENLMKMRQVAPIINRFVRKIGRKISDKFTSEKLRAF